MFRNIIVPLDGSAFGEHALPLAMAVARRAGCGIRLVHVRMPDDPRFPGWYMPSELRPDPKAVAGQTAYLEGVARKLTTAGVAAAPDVVQGETVSELCEYASSRGADLVVMTTHGRGPLSRFWMGSVADALVRELSAPLLLVRPAEGPVDLTTKVRLRHLLITLDGSAHAEAILGPALELGEVMKSAYTLLQVVSPVPVLGYDAFGYAPVGTDEALVDAMSAQALRYLDGVAGRLRERGLHVRPVVAINPSAAGAILAEAEAHGYDAVALETHGRHGPARVLLGSVADKVIRGAVGPVLVHRSKEPPAK
jgi:nucleotide-binding universal stress UspA family protein